MEHFELKAMEEEEATSTVTNSDLSNPNQPAMDPSLHRKHQAMLDRLSNRHQSRSKPSSNTTTTHSATSFLSAFSDSKRNIESSLSSASTLTDPSLIQSHLADISSSISSLEEYLAQNAYLLPSYELRSSLKSVSDLKNSLQTLSSQLVPKRKFSFKTKTTSFLTSITEKNTFAATPEKTILPIPDSPGFRNKQNEVLRKSFKGSSIGEFTLSDLDSCEVYLIGCVNAMFMNRLRNCRVNVGPVRGSALIEDVEKCVFVLAAHQIRIHCAKECDFYVRVRSRPIIEDCSGVRFAPYCLRYEGLEEDLEEAGLNEETSNWSNVDDFKWLRAAKSPNWRVLEEAERIGRVKISNLESGDGDC